MADWEGGIATQSLAKMKKVAIATQEAKHELDKYLLSLKEIHLDLLRTKPRYLVAFPMH